MEAWAGGFVAGRTVERNRALEFEASGTVADLLARTEEVKEQFARDVAVAVFDAPLRAVPSSAFEGPDRELTQGAALQHVYEELAQHHGQMELMRDVLVQRLQPGHPKEGVR